MIRIYNTLTRKIEEFKPLDPPKVRMYSCGPTVYDYQHIGHMRRYVGDDILIRVLEFNRYRVKQVINITDVGHLVSDSDFGEDKMEVGARKLKMDVWQVAKKFEKQFWESEKLLNIKKPALVMHATDYIKEQIVFIQALEQKGFTYKIEDGIYFDTSKFPNYGRLSGQKKEEKKAGARIEMVKGKKNPTDFALWKFSYPKGRSFDSAQDDSALRRQMEWESPWARPPATSPKQSDAKQAGVAGEAGYRTVPGEVGRGIGFPGWHIECSTMAIKGLETETLDIHTGGVDHVAIHHTNEIAQAEAATGKQFVKYWVHHNFLLVEGEKMSKSLGNIYTVEEVIKRGFDPLSLRYLYLQTHYRQEMNFTWEALKGAEAALNRLRLEIAKWDKPKIGCAEFEGKFLEAINNDLNLPEALSIVWDLVKSDYPTSAKAESLFKFDEVLGLNLAQSKELIKKKVEQIPESIMEMVREREKLRRQKHYGQSDQMRNKIKKLGYNIKDTKNGVQVEKL